MATTDGCENPTCEIHGNGPTQDELDSVTSRHDDRIDGGHQPEPIDVTKFAAPEEALNRVITALDDNYDVEDVGYAGDARIVNLRDKLTGGYIMTVTLTHTP